jgi:uncharacterized protein
MSLELFSQILSQFSRYFAEPPKKSQLRLIFHGGEPLLAGLPFFKKVIELESNVNAPNVGISNAIQTNGTLITEEWLEVFKQGSFRVGVSIDGPAPLHNKYRKYKGGIPTFNDVERSIRMLKEEKIPHGLLSVVTEDSPRYYKSFFDLLMQWDISSINFLPFVGPTAQSYIKAYFEFTRDFFDIWLNSDTPFRVLTFLDILKKIGGKQGTLCHLTDNCRKFPTIDSLGKIYPCDRYIGDERYLIGNVSPSSFELSESSLISLQKKLPKHCIGCEVSAICSGGCPALLDPKTGKEIYCSARRSLILYIISRLKEENNDLVSAIDNILHRFDRKTIEWANTTTL